MERSYKQTKKRQKYYSEVTLVLLHYSKHIEDAHFIMDLELQTFYIQDRQTGRVAIAMHSLMGAADFRSHLEFVLLRRYSVNEGRGVSEVRLSVRSTYKFLFPFYVLLLLSIKPTICQCQVD